jgi:hypothetical protein
MWHDRQIVVTSSTGRLPFFAWGNGTTRPAALNYFADLSAKPLVESEWVLLSCFFLCAHAVLKLTVQCWHQGH